MHLHVKFPWKISWIGPGILFPVKELKLSSRGSKKTKIYPLDIYFPPSFSNDEKPASETSRKTPRIKLFNTNNVVAPR